MSPRQFLGLGKFNRVIRAIYPVFDDAGDGRFVDLRSPILNTSVAVLLLTIIDWLADY